MSSKPSLCSQSTHLRLFLGISYFIGLRHPFHKLTDTGACAGHSLKGEGLAFKDVSVCILAEVLSGVVKKFGR